MVLYGKFVATVVATVVSLFVAALVDDTITATEWINIAIGTVSAVGVVIVPNLTEGVAKYAKGVVAALGAALALLVTVIAHGVTVSEWLQVLLAGAAAVGVVALPGPQHPSALPKPARG